jgi:NADH:ubiquinone oxidoreductase subunit 5 (subunit L)/multisubunit Na+/H+ antiporter MnhA subunit
MALITSMLTAFYMFRLYFNIFWNKEAKAAVATPEATTATTKTEDGVTGDATPKRKNKKKSHKDANSKFDK